VGAKSSGLKRDCKSAKKAGIIKSINTTKTPASCTDEVPRVQNGGFSENMR